MSWLHQSLQVNNGKVFQYKYCYLNQIFQSNQNNDQEKRNSDAATKDWFAAKTCDKN